MVQHMSWYSTRIINERPRLSNHRVRIRPFRLWIEGDNAQLWPYVASQRCAENILKREVQKKEAHMIVC